MRTTSTAQRTRICGRCGAVIRKGDPVQVVTLPNVTRERLRCQQCAEDGPTAHPTPSGEAMTRLAALSPALPRDFKIAQTGDDE